MESGRRREDAVQRKADHYEEILKLVMGTDRYERATVAPTLIKTLIKALFDEEYGRENGLYRASTDYFAHRQLEHVVDQLWEAGPPNENIGDAPRSSDEEVTRTIRRQLQLDPNTFANVMAVSEIDSPTSRRIPTCARSSIIPRTSSTFGMSSTRIRSFSSTSETSATTPPGS